MIWVPKSKLMWVKIFSNFMMPIFKVLLPLQCWGRTVSSCASFCYIFNVLDIACCWKNFWIETYYQICPLKTCNSFSIMHRILFVSIPTIAMSYIVFSPPELRHFVKGMSEKSRGYTNIFSRMSLEPVYLPVCLPPWRPVYLFIYVCMYDENSSVLSWGLFGSIYLRCTL